MKRKYNIHTLANQMHSKREQQVEKQIIKPHERAVGNIEHRSMRQRIRKGMWNGGCLCVLVKFGHSLYIYSRWHPTAINCCVFCFPSDVWFFALHTVSPVVATQIRGLQTRIACALATHDTPGPRGGPPRLLDSNPSSRPSRRRQPAARACHACS